MSDSDNSIEFDLFEDLRHKLSERLVNGGVLLLDAERIALYAVQGIQEVPKLLSLLNRDSAADAQIIECLHNVLEGANSLDKAKRLFIETLGDTITKQPKSKAT